ncbi:hypothetical protein GCM10009678_11980 [Actinomadura kijaniata]|uniref:Guanylate cyclase domain-containing protein n=1 Tax=Actinomadura namibiensis TaxID=182080 RepID=A0A7W3LNE8_ACTNM|nr:hypothetical protein [Actinomadura namibiensis]MBA8951324.1 hypothetical protein [Actinomadura namibiensis]
MTHIPAGWERLEATFLVIDINGWSHIVRALGPDPAAAAALVDTFWEKAEAQVRLRDGDIYSWQGDALLAAYRGDPAGRAGRALETAQAVHAVVHDEIQPACAARLRLTMHAARARGEHVWASSALQFSVSSAITDGTAVAVPRSDGRRRTEELTGHCVNLAFALVEEVTPERTGIEAQVHATLRRHGSRHLERFGPMDEKVLQLAYGESVPYYEGRPPMAAPPEERTSVTERPGPSSAPDREPSRRDRALSLKVAPTSQVGA